MAMIETVYVESQVLDHPRTRRILSRLPESVTVIECDHYGEIFNRKNQNFRQQKANPALILAKKMQNQVLATPEGYGIGGAQNYYFSHMQNCIYDCRYCFLQGMYPSAHYLLFVNFEDFMAEIKQLANASDEKRYFFSGYDCDSLAMEGITQFVTEFLPFFAELPNAIFELRTKSTNIRALLKHAPIENCVVAFSFTPEVISDAVEHKVPSVSKRIDAMRRLAEAGWQVGLRFDPLIYADNFQDLYQELVTAAFQDLNLQQVHSISVGPLRFPEKMAQRIIKLYPQDKLLAHPLEKRGQFLSYEEDLENTMTTFVEDILSPYVDKQKIFECHPL